MDLRMVWMTRIRYTMCFALWHRGYIIASGDWWLYRWDSLFVSSSSSLPALSDSITIKTDDNHIDDDAVNVEIKGWSRLWEWKTWTCIRGQSQPYIESMEAGRMEGWKWSRLWPWLKWWTIYEANNHPEEESCYLDEDVDYPISVSYAFDLTIFLLNSIVIIVHNNI